MTELAERLRRAAATTGAAGLDALLITPGADLQYLIGLPADHHASFGERLTCLVLRAEGPPVFVVPRLERPGHEHLGLGSLGVQLADWTDNDDPYETVAGLLPGSAETAVSDWMPTVHAYGLREAMPNTRQVLAGPVLRELRMRKDAAEVAALRKAGEAIDRVHARMGELAAPGRTEAQVGTAIAAAIVEEGHARGGFTIVGSGPNGASPHHDVSDRVIEAGDIVVVDIGGAVEEGYFSDSTRTYCVGGEPSDEVARVYAVLQRAQAAAVAAVRPGVTAESVDAAARTIIADAGYGEYFVHRTGHGIGLQVHEEPYIVAGNDLVLEPGMAFSVEPGIYLPGRWGARIEDIVVVTPEGCEPMNRRPRELVSL
ncbi:MAG TPA: Xaa-Pro peptidase family protein [Pseudonocardiaceae bacterium]|nr:Xaa-Pro peptidase family protein [Pseudonocardiaceae bacterium]